tara:strand:+ start:12584 stop:21598 length:9015 start_codon:yes stop_codon:yes gene_type:complete
VADPGLLEFDEDTKPLVKELVTGVASTGAFLGAAAPLVGFIPAWLRRKRRQWAKDEEVELLKEKMRTNEVEALGDRYLLDNGWTQKDIDELKRQRDDHLDNMRVPRPERIAKSEYPGIFSERAKDSDEISYTPLDQGLRGTENSRPGDNPYYAALMAKREDGRPGFIEQALLDAKHLPPEEAQSIKSKFNAYRQAYVGVADRQSDFYYSMESPMVRSHVEFREAIEDMEALNAKLISEGKPPLEWEDIIFGHEAKILREGIIAAAKAAIGQGQPIVDARTMESMGEDAMGTAEYYGELFGTQGLIGMITGMGTAPVKTMKYKPSIPVLLTAPLIVKFLGGRLSPAMMGAIREHVSKNPSGKLAALQSGYQSAVQAIPESVRKANEKFRPKRREPGGVQKGANAIEEAYAKAGADGLASLIEKPLPGQLVSYTKREALGNIAMWYLKASLLGIPEIMALPLVGQLRNFLRGNPQIEASVFKKIEEAWSTEEGFANRELLEKAREAAENPKRVDEILAQMTDVLRDEYGKKPDDEFAQRQRDREVEIDPVKAKEQEKDAEIIVGQREARDVQVPDVVTDTETTAAPRPTPKPDTEQARSELRGDDELPEARWKEEDKARTEAAKPEGYKGQMRGDYKDTPVNEILEKIENYEAMADYDGNPPGVRKLFREELVAARKELLRRGEKVPTPKERNPLPFTGAPTRRGQATIPTWRELQEAKDRYNKNKTKKNKKALDKAMRNWQAAGKPEPVRPPSDEPLTEGAYAIDIGIGSKVDEVIVVTPDHAQRAARIENLNDNIEGIRKAYKQFDQEPPPGLIESIKNSDLEQSTIRDLINKAEEDIFVRDNIADAVAQVKEVKISRAQTDTFSRLQKRYKKLLLKGEGLDSVLQSITPKGELIEGSKLFRRVSQDEGFQGKSGAVRRPLQGDQIRERDADLEPGRKAMVYTGEGELTGAGKPKAATAKMQDTMQRSPEETRQIAEAYQFEKERKKQLSTDEKSREKHASKERQEKREAELKAANSLDSLSKADLLEIEKNSVAPSLESLSFKELKDFASTQMPEVMNLPYKERNSKAKLIKALGKNGRVLHLVTNDIKAGHKAQKFWALLNQAKESVAGLRKGQWNQRRVLQRIARDAIASGLPLNLVRKILNVIQPNPKNSAMKRRDGKPYQSLGSQVEGYRYTNLIDEIEAGKRGEVTETAVAGEAARPLMAKINDEIGTVFSRYDRELRGIKDPDALAEKANEILERSRDELKELKADLDAAAKGKKGAVEGGFTRGLNKWVKSSYFGEVEILRRNRVENFKRDNPHVTLIKTEPTVADVFKSVIARVEEGVANLEMNIALTPFTQLNKTMNAIAAESFSGKPQRQVSPKARKVLEELGPMDREIPFSKLDEISRGLNDKGLTANEVFALRRNIEARKEVSAPNQEFQNAGVTVDITPEQIQEVRQTKPLNNDIETIEVGKNAPNESIKEFANKAQRFEHRQKMEDRINDAVDSLNARGTLFPESKPYQWPEPTETRVHYGQGYNKELSNLYFYPFEFRGKTFNTAEGAYQAYKSGEYVPGYEKLTGPQAKSKGRGAPVNKETNRALMAEILEAKYDQVPDFRKALDSSGEITHPVRDKFWAKTFPALLTSLRSLKEHKARQSAPKPPAPKPESAKSYTAKDYNKDVKLIAESKWKTTPFDEIPKGKEEAHYQEGKALEAAKERVKAAGDKFTKPPAPKPETAAEVRQEAAQRAPVPEPAEVRAPTLEEQFAAQATSTTPTPEGTPTNVLPSRVLDPKIEAFKKDLESKSLEALRQEFPDVVRQARDYNFKLKNDPSGALRNMKTEPGKQQIIDMLVDAAEARVAEEAFVRELKARRSAPAAAPEGPPQGPPKPPGKPPKGDDAPKKKPLPTVEIKAPVMSARAWSAIRRLVQKFSLPSKIGLSEREVNAWKAGVFEILGNGRSLLASNSLRFAVRNKLVSRITDELPGSFAGAKNKKNREALIEAIDHYLQKFTVPFVGSDNPAAWLSKEAKNKLLDGAAILRKVPGKIRILGEKEKVLGEFNVDKSIDSAIAEIADNAKLMDTIAGEALSQINRNIAGVAKGRSIGRAIIMDLQRRGAGSTSTATVNLSRLASSHLVAREAEPLGLPNRVVNEDGTVVKVSPVELIDGSDSKNVRGAASDPQAFVDALEQNLPNKRKLTDEEIKQYVGEKSEDGTWTVNADSVVGRWLDSLRKYKRLTEKGQKNNMMNILEDALPEEMKQALEESSKSTKDADPAEFSNDFMYDVYVHPDWHAQMSDRIWFKQAAEQYRETFFGWLFGRTKTSYTIMRAKTNLGNTGSHTINIGLNTGETPAAIAARVAGTVWGTWRFNSNPKKFTESNPQLGRAFAQAKRNRFIKTTFSEVEIGTLIEAGYAPTQIIEFAQRLNVPPKVISAISKFMDKGPRNLERARKALYAMEDSYPKTAEFTRHFIDLDNYMNQLKDGDYIDLVTGKNRVTRLVRKNIDGKLHWTRGKKVVSKGKVDELMSQAAKIKTDYLIPDYNLVPRFIRNARAGLSGKGMNPLLFLASPFMSFAYLMLDLPGKPGIVSNTLFGNTRTPMFKTNNMKVNALWAAAEAGRAIRKTAMVQQAAQQFYQGKEYWGEAVRRALRHGLQVGPDPLALFEPSDKAGWIKAYGANNFNAMSQSELFWSQMAYMSLYAGRGIRSFIGLGGSNPLSLEESKPIEYSNKYLNSLSRGHQKILNNSLKIKQRMLMDIDQKQALRPKDILALGFLSGSPMMEIFTKFQTGKKYGQDIENPTQELMADLAAIVLPMGVDTMQILKAVAPRTGMIAPKSGLSAFRNLIMQQEKKIGRNFSAWPREQQIKFMADHTLDAITQVYFREMPIEAPRVIGPDGSHKYKDPHWFKDFYKGFEDSVKRYSENKMATASSEHEMELAKKDFDHFTRAIDAHKAKRRKLMNQMGKLISGDKGYIPNLIIDGKPVQKRSPASIRKSQEDLKQRRLDITKESRRRAATFQQRLEKERQKNAQRN